MFFFVTGTENLARLRRAVQELCRREKPPASRPLQPNRISVDTSRQDKFDAGKMNVVSLLSQKYY